MDKNYFKVEEDSNPRGKIINEQEVKQCIKDYSSWLKNQAKNVYDKMLSNQKASEDKLQQIQKIIKQQLPISVKEILTQFNGGLQLLESFQMFSDEQILNSIEEYQIYGFWSKSFLPIAKDQNDNLLIINFEKNQQVIIWNRDEGVVEESSENFEIYMENLRNGVLGNEYEYIDEVGLVQKI